jgi:nucleolar protein TMA23
MNASSLLLSQGWSGPSTPLNPHSSTAHTHITKPLLIAQKKNTLGVGNNPNGRHGADQWWLRDFEDALKSIGTGNAQGGERIKTKAVGGVLGAQGSVAGKGLYGWFVRGEGLEGTIGKEEGERVRETRKVDRGGDGEVLDGEGAQEGAAERRKAKNRRKRRGSDAEVANEGVERPPENVVRRKERPEKMAKKERRLAELEQELQQLKHHGTGDDETRARAISKLEKRIRKRRTRLQEDA